MRWTPVFFHACLWLHAGAFSVGSSCARSLDLRSYKLGEPAAVHEAAGLCQNRAYLWRSVAAWQISFSASYRASLPKCSRLCRSGHALVQAAGPLNATGGWFFAGELQAVAAAEVRVHPLVSPASQVCGQLPREHAERLDVEYNSNMPDSLASWL